MTEMRAQAPGFSHGTSEFGAEPRRLLHPEGKIDP
jgi:hypothetical protein